MTPQSVSSCQASGVSRARHPAGHHDHVPAGLRAVHGRTGEKILWCSQDSNVVGWLTFILKEGVLGVGLCVIWCSSYSTSCPIAAMFPDVGCSRDKVKLKTNNLFLQSTRKPDVYCQSFLNKSFYIEAFPLIFLNNLLDATLQYLCNKKTTKKKASGPEEVSCHWKRLTQQSICFSTIFEHYLGR